ncbi:hypothetical protein D5272_16490 [bacterium D16-76]|nr:hypothetical protein [bacterium D16-76]
METMRMLRILGKRGRVTVPQEVRDEIYFSTRLLSEAYTDALHDQYDRSRRQKKEDHHGGRHDG